MPAPGNRASPRGRSALLNDIRLHNRLVDREMAGLPFLVVLALRMLSFLRGAPVAVDNLVSAEITFP